MKKNGKNKIIVISIVVVTLLLVGCASLFLYNHLTVSSAIHEQKTTFENKIKTMSAEASKEDKASKIKSVTELKQLEKEIDQFSKKVNFTEITKADFKSENELAHQKLQEAIEFLNFSYKVRLDENVKEVNDLKKADLIVLVENLDKLIQEIKSDNILTVDVIKTFEDKAKEMKEIYTAKIKEFESAEVVTEANEKKKNEKEVITTIEISAE